MVSKQYILEEVKKLALENQKSPGFVLFEKATGLPRSSWQGKYWAKWSDLLIEAGLQPNEFQKAYSKEEILNFYLNLVIKLNKIPTAMELRLEGNSTANFPTHTTFGRNLGSQNERLTSLLDYANSQQTPAHIIELIMEALSNSPKKSDKTLSPTKTGYVYFFKSGDFYKIGRSNDIERRLTEIKTKLPEKTEIIHTIETDDPEGIEGYWHNRFKEKRANGEWFRLNNDDLKIIRKRKFM